MRLPAERVRSLGGAGGSRKVRLATSPLPVRALTSMSSKTLVQAVRVVVTCPELLVRNGALTLPAGETIPPAQLAGKLVSEKTIPAAFAAAGTPSLSTVTVMVE